MDRPDSEYSPGTNKRSSRASKGDAQGARAQNSGSQRAETLIPSRSLRYTNADFTQAELRLRRLESFVTSNQYELHRELAKIEREQESDAKVSEQSAHS